MGYCPPSLPDIIGSAGYEYYFRLPQDKVLHKAKCLGLTEMPVMYSSYSSHRRSCKEPWKPFYDVQLRIIKDITRSLLYVLIMKHHFSQVRVSSISTAFHTPMDLYAFQRLNSIVLYCYHSDNSGGKSESVYHHWKFLG